MLRMLCSGWQRNLKWSPDVMLDINVPSIFLEKISKLIIKGVDIQARITHFPLHIVLKDL